MNSLSSAPAPYAPAPSASGFALPCATPSIVFVERQVPRDSGADSAPCTRVRCTWPWLLVVLLLAVLFAGAVLLFSSNRQILQ